MLTDELYQQPKQLASNSGSAGGIYGVGVAWLDEILLIMIIGY
jgi:hypothetical protein